jgi:hypothetical protein
LPRYELEDAVLAALIDEGAVMGFSLMYAHLHEEGLANPADGLSALEELEARSWVRILCYRDGRLPYQPATREQRHEFVAAYPKLKPTWNPDVDYGGPNLHVEITDEGKAEWRRRHPLERDHAWTAEHDPEGHSMTVWAIDEAVADSVADSTSGPQQHYAAREVEPARFELKTGVVDGVKVTYTWLNPDATTQDS